MIIAKYQYTEQVAIQANREVTRAIVPWFRLFPFAGILSLVVYAYVVLVQHEDPLKSIFPLVFGCLMCALPMLTKRQVAKQFRANPNANLEVLWQIDDRQLANETKGASATFEWNKLIKVVERSEGFLLFPQPKLAHWIPKSAFENDEQIGRFREIVRERGLAR